MITYTDLKEAINNLLIKAFGYEINSNDLKEGFNRPSFFVDFDNVGKSSSETQVERNLTVQIYFFPSKRNEYSIEVLEVLDKLESLFDLKLPVLDRRINITDTTSEVTDGVLHFSFDIQFFDGKTVSIDGGVVLVDDQGQPVIDSAGNPVFVRVDEEGTIIKDQYGEPIRIEMMNELDMKKG